jgi:divalent metal cation (Fe/Co/Zn/Cd) transporter
MASGNISLENIFTILFGCLIPIILVVIWTISFIRKTKSDKCNKLNYTCDPPQTDVVLGNVPPKQPFANINNLLTQEEKKASNDALKEQDGTVMTTTSTIPNITTTEPTSTIIAKSEIEQIDKCVSAPKLIKRATPDSKYTMKTLKWTTLGLIFLNFFLIFTLGKTGLFGIMRNDDRLALLDFDDHPGYNNRLINTIISWIVLFGQIVLMIFYLARDNNYNVYLAFNLSLIVLFGILGLSEIRTEDDQPLFPKPITYIFVALFLALLAGTIYMFKFQEDNIKEGKISHAINEAIMAMIPPFMAIFVLISFGLIIKHLFQGGNKIFGITQIISLLILIACITMYYDYSKKCRESIPKCELDIKTKHYDVQTALTGKKCVPYTGMNITTETITNMGIAISVIIGLNNIGGAIALSIADLI